MLGFYGEGQDRRNYSKNTRKDTIYVSLNMLPHEGSHANMVRKLVAVHALALS